MDQNGKSECSYGTGRYMNNKFYKYFLLVIGISFMLTGCKSVTGIRHGLLHHYETYQTKGHYRVFVSTDDSVNTGSAVNYRHNIRRNRIKSAIGPVIDKCNDVAENVQSGTDCKLHSIGDIDAQGFSEEKINQAIDFYKDNKTATNESFEAYLKGGSRQISSVTRSSDSETSESNTTSQQKRYGSLPSFINDKGKRSYDEKYLAKNVDELHHKAFVVAQDNSWGWASGNYSRVDAVSYAFARCKKHSDGCRLYDIDDIPVDGLSQVEAESWIESKFGPAASNKPDGGRAIDPYLIVRPVAFEWEGLDQLMVGEIQFKKGDGGGIFSVQMPNSESQNCTGTYRYKTKTDGIWNVACTDSRAASGTFITHGKNAGSSGTGKDTKGNSVKFTVAAERK
jgi:hypothetical protein